MNDSVKNTLHTILKDEINSSAHLFNVMYSLLNGLPLAVLQLLIKRVEVSCWSQNPL